MESIVPVFTPFKDDEKRTIDYDVIPKYAEYLKQQQIRYVLVNGTTGEGPSLTVAERKQITEVWMKECQKNGLYIMVQIGGTNFTDVMELAIHANKLGVNSILCLPELYFKPESADDLVMYFEKICAVVPKIPVYFYHIPMITKVHVDLVEFLTKMKPVTNFSGMKFTSESLAEGSQLVHLDKQRYKMFLGNDEIMVGAYAQGFTGFIGTTLNLFPKRILQIQEYMVKGDMDSARVAQLELNHLIKKIMKHGSWVVTMKEAMNLVAPVKVGHPRLPLKTMSSVHIDEMKVDLKTEM